MNKTLKTFSLRSSVIAAILGASTFMGSANAGDISANVALTSDYYFRGISQTANDPAIQGGFDWGHDSGFYAGVWGSNVAFGATNVELDTYIGFSNEVSGIGYDIGLIKYNYNQTPNDSDPLEIYLGLSYEFLSAGYAYSSNWFGSDLSSNYVYLSADYGLPADFNLAASIGYSFGDTYSDYEYVDYKLGVSKDVAGVTLDLSYIANDLSTAQCNSYGYTQKNCDNRLILTVSKEF